MLKNYASGNFFQLIQLHNLEQLLKLLIWEFYITCSHSNTDASVLQYPLCSM